MNKGIVAAVVVAAVALLVVLFRPSKNDDSSDAELGTSNRSHQDSVRAGGERSESADRSASRHVPGGDPNLGSGKSGSDFEARRNDAAAVRERLAGAGSHAVAGGVRFGSTDGTGEETVDGSTGEVAEQQAAMHPKTLAGVHDAQSSQGATINETGEAVPEVAYDGGLDKSYTTDKQAAVKDAGKISGDAGTVSFWVKPGWTPDSQDDASFVQLGDSSLRFAKNVNYLRFEYFDKSGAEQGVGVNIGDWQQSNWYQVTGTWSGRTYQLFVDGKQVSQNTFAQPPDFQNETQLLVGSDFSPGVPVAPANITGLQVLNRTSSAGEIAQQHQTGQKPQ